MTAKIFQFPPGGRDGPPPPREATVEEVLTAALRTVRLDRFPASACMLILTDDTGENRLVMHTSLSRLEMIGLAYSVAHQIDTDDVLELGTG